MRQDRFRPDASLLPLLPACERRRLGLLKDGSDGIEPLSIGEVAESAAQAVNEFASALRRVAAGGAIGSRQDLGE